MKQKNFYNAFNVMYGLVKDGLGISQKEEFYRLLFRDVYLLAGDDLYDNDTIRKVTAGNSTIHRKAVKVLCTDEGFETLRINLAEICLPKLSDREGLVSELQTLLNADTVVPDNIKQNIADSVASGSDYHISQAIAATLVCLNHSDYICGKGKDSFIDVSFMRLASDRPIPKYPRYITDSPDSAAEKLIGREDELEELRMEIVDNEGKMMISSVGGLGKTELAKMFLNQIGNTEYGISGIERIAWIPYGNQDIRLSMKQALRLRCDLNEVWPKIQDMALEFGRRLLLVIDNVERAESDEYLRKLSLLQCRILVTSRQKNLMGFSKVIYLQPLKMDKCRDLFYRHYQFAERNNEVVNDIIDLTAKLTIMIVFIAKAAYLEGMSLHELYAKLVQKGFKLSDEDVSCEHEKLQSDATIIRQMCVLFSIVSYSNDDKKLLTYISVIPNLQFDFSKAKKWFKTKKNSSLLKLFNMGMLEHTTKKRTHIYWMHSVIASAIREQQKDKLYDTAEAFVHELSEELELGEYWGKGYTKIDLIPFSWSVADLFENHWGNEDDSVFLLRLYYVCFEASNFPLCKKLIEKVIEIDKGIGDSQMLIRDYKNYSELWLRLDKASNAIDNLKIAQEYMEKMDPKHRLKREWAYLWHQYGNIYFHKGEANTALDYYRDALKIDLTIHDLPSRELSTDYSSIAAVYQMFGDLPSAYKMLKKAMEIDLKDEEDSESIMNDYYMAMICTDFVSDGYDEYCKEAETCYEKVIAFREKYFAKNSNDLADVYLEYSHFLYQIGENEESSFYCNKAYDIYLYLYGDDSYHVLQCLSNKALVLAESGKPDDALALYKDIIGKIEGMEDIPLSDLCTDYQNYAGLLEQSGKYEESREYYWKCINLTKKSFSKDSPRLAQPYLGLANCCMGMEAYELAISHLIKLKALADDDPLLLRVMNHKLGTCSALLKNYDVAVKYFEDAVALCDENGELDRGYIYVDLSINYYFMGKASKAAYYENLAREFERKFEDVELSAYVHTLDTFLGEK